MFVLPIPCTDDKYSAEMKKRPFTNESKGSQQWSCPVSPPGVRKWDGFFFALALTLTLPRFHAHSVLNSHFCFHTNPGISALALRTHTDFSGTLLPV